MWSDDNEAKQCLNIYMWRSLALAWGAWMTGVWGHDGMEDMRECPDAEGTKGRTFVLSLKASQRKQNNDPFRRNGRSHTATVGSTPSCRSVSTLRCGHCLSDAE